MSRWIFVKVLLGFCGTEQTTVLHEWEVQNTNCVAGQARPQDEAKNEQRRNKRTLEAQKPQKGAKQEKESSG